VGRLNEALASAVILLSLVLVVGYGGQVSLCQLTFAGLSAWTMGQVGHGLIGAAAGIAVAAIGGLIVALPTVRLRGLYLALATLAFAQAMDSSFFNRAFGTNGSLAVPRIDLPVVDVTSDRGFLVLSLSSSRVVRSACSQPVAAASVDGSPRSATLPLRAPPSGSTSRATSSRSSEPRRAWPVWAACCTPVLTWPSVPWTSISSAA
jgi:hypothetical protein